MMLRYSSPLPRHGAEPGQIANPKPPPPIPRDSAPTPVSFRIHRWFPSLSRGSKLSKSMLYNLVSYLVNLLLALTDGTIRNLFSAKTIHDFSTQSLLTFLVMFYILAVVTFDTPVPAKQFVPSIMIGSTYGRLVGMFVVNFYKKAQH